MERSYRVLLDIVKSRHATIPDAVFRWSEGAYLLYVANTCSRSLEAGAALRYLGRAARCDPALVAYRRFLRLLARNSVPRAAGRGRRGVGGGPYPQ